MRLTRSGIAGVSEVMFPENTFGAPDWQTTQMVERTIDYLGELPPKMRRLVMLLFIAVELGAPFLGVGLGRFSRIGAERRLKVLLSWRNSRIVVFKLLADALKAQLCMMFLSHRDVQMYIEVWKACDRPGDPMDLPVREGMLSGDTHNGLRASEGP